MEHVTSLDNVRSHWKLAFTLIESDLNAVPKPYAVKSLTAVPDAATNQSLAEIVMVLDAVMSGTGSRTNIFTKVQPDNGTGP